MWFTRRRISTFRMEYEDTGCSLPPSQSTRVLWGLCWVLGPCPPPHLPLYHLPEQKAMWLDPMVSASGWTLQARCLLGSWADREQGLHGVRTRLEGCTYTCSELFHLRAVLVKIQGGGKSLLLFSGQHVIYGYHSPICRPWPWGVTDDSEAGEWQGEGGTVPRAGSLGQGGEVNPERRALWVRSSQK